MALANMLLVRFIYSNILQVKISLFAVREKASMLAIIMVLLIQFFKFVAFRFKVSLLYSLVCSKDIW